MSSPLLPPRIVCVTIECRTKSGRYLSSKKICTETTYPFVTLKNLIIEAAKKLCEEEPCDEIVVVKKYIDIRVEE